MTRPMTCQELEPLTREAARALAAVSMPHAPEAARTITAATAPHGVHTPDAALKAATPMTGDRPTGEADLRRRRTEGLSDEDLERVRDHLGRCPSCTDRLQRERALDSRLAALATQEEPVLPPALEHRLTQAFRARFGEGGKQDTQDSTLPTHGGAIEGDVFRLSGSNGASDPSTGGRQDTRLRTGAGAGAAEGEVFRRRGGASQRGGRLAGQRSRGGRILLGALAVAAAAAAAVLVAVQLREEPTLATREAPAPFAPPTYERGPVAITGPAGLPGTDLDPAASASDGVEIVSVQTGGASGAFVPLGWDAAVRPIELGRVARVQLPTSVAARFGWPLLPDDEARVSADVLVAEDGTARALRFLPATYTRVSFPKE
jgi:hypothetical protein